MALALNNLKRVDMPLNKETKPNQTNWPLGSLTSDSLLRNPSPKCPSAPDWLTSFFILFRSHRFSWTQLFVWSSHLYRQRKVFWTLRRRFKDVGDKIPSMATHPRTHRETHTYISIYTLRLIIVPKCYKKGRSVFSTWTCSTFIFMGLLWLWIKLLVRGRTLCSMNNMYVGVEKNVRPGRKEY